MTIFLNRLCTTKDTTTGHELIFDTQTGEFLESQKLTMKKHIITTDVGTQCRFPIDL